MMEDENNEKDHMFCPWCKNGKHWLLRWLLGLFILAAVFWFGVQVGELKSYVFGGYGYPMMGGYYGGYNMMGPGGYYGPMYNPMMRGWNNYYPPATNGALPTPMPTK